MQRLAEICIRRPVFASMLILALMVVGAASWLNLAVDRFPAVDLPNVRVRTVLPGASPEEVEVQITERIEESINAVAGLNELRSVSGAGVSQVLPTFELGRDIDTATQDVRDRVAAVLRDLPAGTEPPLIAQDRQRLGARPDDGGLGRARRCASLPRSPTGGSGVRSSAPAGVGEVAVVGGLERAINIWIDADRLAAYRLPIGEVRAALAQPERRSPGREHHLTDHRADPPNVRSNHGSARFQRPGDQDRQRARRSGSATSAGPRTARKSSGRSRCSTACRRCSWRSAARAAPTPSRPSTR